MSDLPQPEYVAYRLNAQSDGMQVDVMTQGGQVWLNVHGGTGAAAVLEHHGYAGDDPANEHGGRCHGEHFAREHVAHDIQ